MKIRTVILCALAALLLCGLCACGERVQSVDTAAALAGDGVHHVAYADDGSGSFRPDDDLTRADCAVMLGRLLGVSDAGAAEYPDVPGDSACAAAVSALTDAGLLQGRTDGLFHPDEAVTRAELVSLACRLAGVSGGGHSGFIDVPAQHWAADAIRAASDRRWVSGYADGTFLPDAPVSRAEAVAILNRALGRRADFDVPAPAVGYAAFSDVTAAHWAFFDILEAGVAHDYSYADSPCERWSNYELTVLGAVPGAQVVNGLVCCADPETLELLPFEQGFNTINGQLFYAGEAGLAADYHPAGPFELQGAMYCANPDGSLLVNGDWGHLHFGPDGRYTTGDPEVDGMVNQLLGGLLQDTSMTQEEKLYAAYCIIRDDGFKYATRGDVYDRGTTDWALACAKKFYRSQKGTCFYFTSGFMFLARRLGYDAYPVVGGVWSNNAYHSWVMINWPDGEEYIFDVELEWAYLHGHYSDTPKHYDLFKQPVDDSLFIYNFPDAAG